MAIVTGQQATAADVLVSDRHFVELAGGENRQNSSNATWQDWDLSGTIPSGGKYALIAIGSNSTSSANSCGVRKNGSALNRRGALDGPVAVATRWDIVVLVELDANRIIETYAQWKDDGFFNLLGYWKEA